MGISPAEQLYGIAIQSTLSIHKSAGLFTREAAQQVRDIMIPLLSNYRRQQPSAYQTSLSEHMLLQLCSCEKCKDKIMGHTCHVHWFPQTIPFCTTRGNVYIEPSFFAGVFLDSYPQEG